ncbi:MAG: SDR family NAD(P)-dependent oxidoreductase [Eggerthellaceae bacterium]|nr:SDR family NAD(P)-dependent oxidoreductase [Eggerthellaceae bacterium]
MHQPSKRIAVITGASSGMGREFARQIDLLQQADELWLIARGEEALRDVAASLTTPARCLPADLTDAEACHAIARLLDEEAPFVSFLVNAAGFGKFGDWSAIDEADAEAMIDLNCRALVALTRACLPHMGRGSHVIELCSASAFTPLPHLNVYASTKAFVLSYTRALRWELHGTGITATAVCPTWVKTGFEKVARQSGAGHDVGHLLGAQDAATVVSRALAANRAHLAVATCSPQALALRVLGKVLPHCVTMAGWEAVRRV